MSSKYSIELNSSLANYFRTRLHEAGQQSAVPPQEDTLCYIGNMLARFGDSAELFSYDEGYLELRPLAMLYKDAHETNNHRERCLILRQLGDMALFIGAVFPENYQRRGILKDYFVGMGGGAYGYLSENSADNRHIYAELATTFTRLLALIAEACTKESIYDHSDVLDLYQRWHKSRDAKIAAQLQALGIMVADTRHIH